jgi:CxxC-x17-CxxC domain-containing protein
LIYVQDKTITCRDCGQQFTFTAREQLAFAQKGLKAPVCCAFCRAARGIASGARNFAPANRSEQAWYPAVCADCGRATSVPFEPRSGRPVYCRTCYKDHQGSSGGYSGGQSRSSRYTAR